MVLKLCGRTPLKVGEACAMCLGTDRGGSTVWCGSLAGRAAIWRHIDRIRGRGGLQTSWRVVTGSQRRVWGGGRFERGRVRNWPRGGGEGGGGGPFWGKRKGRR